LAPRRTKGAYGFILVSLAMDPSALSLITSLDRLLTPPLVTIDLLECSKPPFIETDWPTLVT